VEYLSVLRRALGDGTEDCTSELAFGKTVMIVATGKDRHERTVADVFLPDSCPESLQDGARVLEGRPPANYHRTVEV
jgi:hypothetical protein